eukprot:scaffold9618_cov27-Tisochrysis_lutea.AAC.1
MAARSTAPNSGALSTGCGRVAVVSGSVMQTSASGEVPPLSAMVFESGAAAVGAAGRSLHFTWLSARVGMPCRPAAPLPPGLGVVELIVPSSPAERGFGSHLPRRVGLAPQVTLALTEERTHRGEESARGGHTNAYGRQIAGHVRRRQKVGPREDPLVHAGPQEVCIAAHRQAQVGVRQLKEQKREQPESLDNRGGRERGRRLGVAPRCEAERIEVASDGGKQEHLEAGALGHRRARVEKRPIAERMQCVAERKRHRAKDESKGNRQRERVGIGRCRLVPAEGSIGPTPWHACEEHQRRSQLRQPRSEQPQHKGARASASPGSRHRVGEGGGGRRGAARGAADRLAPAPATSCPREPTHCWRARQRAVVAERAGTPEAPAPHKRQRGRHSRRRWAARRSRRRRCRRAARHIRRRADPPTPLRRLVREYSRRGGSSRRPERRESQRRSPVRHSPRESAVRRRRRRAGRPTAY